MFAMSYIIMGYTKLKKALLHMRYYCVINTAQFVCSCGFFMAYQRNMAIIARDLNKFTPC